MNFQESESYLYSLGNEVEAMKLGLDNIRKLLAALGDPQTNYLKVQVAGTNGKGSVCAFLNSICLEASIKTGLFTSPHLASITERIKIDGVGISKDDFALYATRVRATAERSVESGELTNTPTFFEQVTAIALLAFAAAKVELAILETGLGGRLDATTAANAEIVAITRIDLDHQEHLGNTIEEIAAEKAAIINDEFDDVVIGKQHEAALKVILERCRKFGTIPVNERYSTWTVTNNDFETVRVETTRYVFPQVTLGLKGKHQIENAETAINIAQSLRYDCGADFEDADLIAGLENARHPGRLEYQGRYLFDGAHNVGGAKALRDYLDEFETRPITLIFGAMNDKNVAEIIEILESKAERFVFTKPDNERAFTAIELDKFVSSSFNREGVFLTDSVADAISKANELTDKGDLILITGSLYLVGEAKKILNN